ncbi:hypothetical protein [Candidatus Skiveiella danica]|uniref:hypothetical protein n=1 Tax=Candidatus Skiveiella danica TaxID=3386177 RepID=UPI0039B81FD9
MNFPWRRLPFSYPPCSAPPRGRGQHKPREGKDYLVLGKQAPTDAPPARSRWSNSSGTAARTATRSSRRWSLGEKPAQDVSFKRVPVAFRDDFHRSDACYTLEP